MKRILILDYDQNTLFRLKRILQTELFDVSATDDPKKAANLFQSRTFHAVIIGTRKRLSENLDIIGWFKRKSISSHLILITVDDNISSEDFELYRKNGVSYVFSRPVDYVRVRKAVTTLLDETGFSVLLQALIWWIMCRCCV